MAKSYGVQWRRGGDFEVSEFDALTFAAGPALPEAARALLSAMTSRFARAAAGTVTIAGLTTPMCEWLEGKRGVLPHVDRLLRADATAGALPEMFESGPADLGTFTRLPPLLLAGRLAQRCAARSSRDLVQTRGCLSAGLHKIAGGFVPCWCAARDSNPEPAD